MNAESFQNLLMLQNEMCLLKLELLSLYIQKDFSQFSIIMKYLQESLSNEDKYQTHENKLESFFQLGKSKRFSISFFPSQTPMPVDPP